MQQDIAYRLLMEQQKLQVRDHAWHACSDRRWSLSQS
jgi:hypothetical protein